MFGYLALAICGVFFSGVIFYSVWRNEVEGGIKSTAPLDRYWYK